jgi:hypothetical protein
MKKIKTAEEYLIEFKEDEDYYHILEILKKAQLDMLEYAVNKCNKNAEVRSVLT